MTARERILIASHRSGAGHVPSSFSVLEIVRMVFFVLGPHDTFVMSKAHAQMALYAVMAERGELEWGALDTVGLPGGLPVHPEKGLPHVAFSCGSLGVGIGYAVGVALARKQMGLPGRVYCLIGDGEANEGIVWEAVQVAVAQKLANLSILYDKNNSQERGCPIRTPAWIFADFGCYVTESDGHAKADILAVLCADALIPNGPRVHCFNTIKGYGSPTMQADANAWHRRSPTADELPKLIAELRVEEDA